MKKKLNIADIMGGIGIGTKSIMNRAGENNVNVVSYIDNGTDNSGCVEAYNNFFGTSFEPSDITTYDFKDIKDIIDIAVVSFPSNSFSDENYVMEHYKRQNMLWGKQKIAKRCSIPMSVYDFCEQINPRAVVFDLTLNQKATEQNNNLSDFLARLNNLGFDYAKHEYNAYEYNAPQDRNRMCILAFNSSIHLNRPFVFPKGVVTPKTIRDILVDNYDISYVIDNNDFKTIYENSKYVKLIKNIDGYLNTITANYGGGNKGYSALVPCKEKSGYRFLTPLEIFRAMGLKDDYYYFLSEFFDDSTLYRLAGNSMIGNYCDNIMQQLLNLSEFRVWEQQVA